MELIRNQAQLRPHHQNCVATIGNFDGVHLGHQAILRQLMLQAQQRQLPAVVIIFEPQPQEFFAPQQANARLTRLREKLMALRRYGVSRVLCLHFNTQLAALSAHEFIEKILVQGLKIQHLVVGDDFRFGRDRQGHFELLQQRGQQYGFTVASQPTFIIEGERVSSTRVRQALEQGDMLMAQQLLGRPYTLCGRVRYGQQRGRSIGFPTANIFLHRPISPLTGVFAVTLHGIHQQPLPGVANLGTRPTVDGTQFLLEVHLFDFQKTIYGQYVEVEFICKLRDEQRFNSFSALKQQIVQDVQVAKAVFSS
jgi:riboflavin kinase/FMN adenylyltransferase